MFHVRRRVFGGKNRIFFGEPWFVWISEWRKEAGKAELARRSKVTASASKSYATLPEGKSERAVSAVLDRKT